MTIYTPGSTAGVPLNVIGSLGAPDALLGHRGGDAARRDRGHRDEPARARRHRRRPALEPRARPALEPDRERVARRSRPRPRHADRRDPVAAAPQARRVRDRPVLPAAGPHGARLQAQRARRLAVVRRLGRRARRSTRSRCSSPRDGKPRAAIVYLAHLSDEERQFVVDARLREARHLDARPGGHARPARARVHGRGLRATCRRPPLRRRRSRS